MQLEIRIAFRRALMLEGPGSDAISLTCARPVSHRERQLLAAHLDGLLPAWPVDGAFPKFMRTPSVNKGAATELAGRSHHWHTLQNLSFSLRGVDGGTGGAADSPSGAETSGAQFWEVRQRAPPNPWGHPTLSR